MTDRQTRSLLIRSARPAEYSRIALLTVAAYRHDHQVRAGHPYEVVLADVAGRAAAGELLVAVEPAAASAGSGGSDRVLGSVLLVRSGSRYAELCGPDEAEFRTLAVDPAAQRRGVGEALVRACLEKAAGQGCTAVVIFTRDFATAAHRLYERFGFVRTPERDWQPRRGINLWALRRDLSGWPGGGQE